MVHQAVLLEECQLTFDCNAAMVTDSLPFSRKKPFEELATVSNNAGNISDTIVMGNKRAKSCVTRVRYRVQKSIRNFSAFIADVMASFYGYIFVALINAITTDAGKELWGYSV